MPKLFTYGTLSRRRRLEALVGRKLAEPSEAVLPGYKKYPTPRGYPIILPHEGEEVTGLLWEIEEEDLAPLDHYEGSDEDPPFYTRHRVQVEVLDRGKRVEAFVYVGNPDVFWDVTELE